MASINEIERDVIDALDGREKLKALLRSRAGISAKDFAIRHGLYLADVSKCMGGDRPLHEIRDLLADDLDLPREEVDRLIDGSDEKEEVA